MPDDVRNPRSTEDEDVVVVGAGAAGLSVAGMLRRRGVDALVLERAEHVASSWRSRYESLRLNSPRLNSTLAGYRMPRRYGRWLTRDDMIEYLEEFARRHDLRIRSGTTLTRVERKPDGRWLLDTSTGELTARFAVIATGHDTRPKLPDWPGRNEFTGELVHSASYRNARPFAGKSVLVVSARNSGTEISYELATTGGCRVWTSMRTPPNVFPREWLGLPLQYPAVLCDPLPDVVLDSAGRFMQRVIYGDLAKHGIPRAGLGIQTATKRHHLSLLVDAGFIEALKARKVEMVAAVERFDGDTVVLADGRRLQPQVVIAATGYETDLDRIVGHLGVLDERGLPSLDGGSIRSREHPTTPGLFFNGFHVSAAGQLRFMRIDGRRIARTIARRL